MSCNQYIDSIIHEAGQKALELNELLDFTIKKLSAKL